jgi:DnaJ-class molecular chaperone
VTLQQGRHRLGHEEDFDSTATRLVRCPHCRGTGSQWEQIPLPCPVCHGKGWVRAPVPPPVPH